jgi:hypothetical protein
MYRGISEFKRGYRPRSNLVKEENGDLLADAHDILNRSKNYSVIECDVKQIEIHTAEPLVPYPSPFEVEIAVAKLKGYKSPGNDQIQAGGEIL